MTESVANNKRIANNTLILYVRMLLVMGIGLYTSRVVLNTLGVEDFGIYNAVAGVVSLFSFLNMSMASSTQRYLTFELGMNNQKALKQVFSTSLLIHALIALVVIILLEPIGLYLLYNKMVIPIDRMDTAMWIFQLSLLVTVLSILTTPCHGTIVAHEKMSIFAYISIIDAFLKLGGVILLQVMVGDHLKLYTILIFCVQLLSTVLYFRYCVTHFKECRFRRYWNPVLCREIAGFAGWNLFGNLAAVSFTQGLNILLNIFFNPTVNAARGIAVQVQAVVYQFCSSFQTALNPQITKTYANGELVQMHTLIIRSSKFSFFLLFFLSLPILFETPLLLKWWLGIVPDHTVDFLRIILITSMIDATANPLMTSAQATGSIRLYQSVVGSLLLLILPFSYVALKMGGKPESVFLIHLSITCIAWVVRLYMIHRMIHLSIRIYIKQVLLPIVGVVITSILPLWAIWPLMMENRIRLLITICISIASVLLSVFLLGLEKEERCLLQEKIYSR